MSFARSTLRLFGVRVGSVVIGFLALVVFAREIGVAALGSYFLFQALLIGLSLVTDIGLRSAVEKRLSEGQSADEVLGTGVGLKAAFLSGGLLAVVALRDPIAAFVGVDLAGLLVVAAVFRDAGRLLTFTLRGELRVDAAATAELARKITFGVVGIALAVAGYGVYAPVYGVIAGYAAMTVVGGIRVRTRPGRPTIGMARSLLSFSRYKFISNAGSVGYSWIDVVVIGLFLSPAAVGAYEVAWKVAAIVVVFSDSLATTAFPQLSEDAGHGDTERIEVAFTRLVTPSMAFVIPAFFGTLVLAEDILGVLFGAEYTVASLALVILLADSLSSGVYQLVARMLDALDAPHLDARGVVLQITLNVALNLLFVPRYGLVGAAIATTLAAFAGETLSLFYLSRLVTVRFEWRLIAWCVVSAAGMAAILWAVRQAVVVETPLVLLSLVALGVGSYLAFALSVPSLRQRALDRLTAIRTAGA
jgi:O-antigen/teichoic acid export membrane protein